MATRKKTNQPAQAPNLQFIDLAQIRTLPQVRTEFNEAGIDELAANLKTHGMLQPVLLRPGENEMQTVDGLPVYLVIAGERRIRAAQRAGLTAVPAIVGPADDETAATMQLIENIQREDLSLKDTAAGVLMLYEKHKSLAPVAQIVQKSLSWVSKHLSIATKLSFHATKLMEEGTTEDLELLMTVSQIEVLPNAWPRGVELIAKIEEKKAGRKEARALLEQLRKEIDEAKAERKGAKKRQQELTLNQEQADQQAQVWEPGDGLSDLYDQLQNTNPAPIGELIKAFDAKQQKAIATMPAHLDAHRLGKKVHGKTDVEKLRALGELGHRHRELRRIRPGRVHSRDHGPEATLHDLATEAAAVMKASLKASLKASQ
jgi:ParB/RepB/Spo0J family partition protein